MNQQDYLDKLELELRRLNVSNISEVLADYAEHFSVGKSNGKTDKEIADKLGDPSLIAKAYQAENLISKMQSSQSHDQIGYFFKAVLRIIILTPFNFFMMLGPFLITACMIFAGWAVALSLGGTGIAAGLAMFAMLPLAALGFWGAGALLFGALAIIGMSLIGMFIMFFVTKILMQMFVKYLQWNVKFIKGT